MSITAPLEATSGPDTPGQLYEAFQRGSDPYLPGVIRGALAANDLPDSAAEPLQDVALTTLLDLVTPGSSMTEWLKPRKKPRLTAGTARSRINAAVSQVAQRMGETLPSGPTEATTIDRFESAVVDPWQSADPQTTRPGVLDLMLVISRLPPTQAAVLLLFVSDHSLESIGRRRLTKTGTTVSRERASQIRYKAIGLVREAVETDPSYRWARDIYVCPTEIRIRPVATLPIARSLFKQLADSIVGELGIAPPQPAEGHLAERTGRYLVHWRVAAGSREQARAIVSGAVLEAQRLMGGSGSKIRVSYLGARLDIPAVSNPLAARRGQQPTMHYPWQQAPGAVARPGRRA